MVSRFNCAPKFDEKVRIPTREQIRDVCENFRNTNLNRIFLTDELVKILGKFIADSFSVNVTHSSAIAVDPGDINIAAYYDCNDDEYCNISIELVLITNPKDASILFDQTLYDSFVKYLADALVHELVHMKQARARDFIPLDDNAYNVTDKEREIIYLSNPDEIDAYSYNIAAELNDNPDPLKILHNPLSVSIEESINLWVYMNVFNRNLNEPTLRRLLKKIYKKLDK